MSKLKPKLNKRTHQGIEEIRFSKGQKVGIPSKMGLDRASYLMQSGYILTNEHVINGADEIDVYVQGYDTPFTATLLGSSYDLDLAVLKIQGDKAFPALKIGNSDNTRSRRMGSCHW